MNYNEDRNRKITKYGHRAKKQQQQDKNTGLTLPPPPGRCVHTCHIISNGEGERKGGCSGGPYGQACMGQEASRMVHVPGPMVDQAVQGVMAERAVRGAMAEQGALGAMAEQAV